MKHSIEYKPYTEYWIDCVLSLELSLISSREPSYLDAAVMNHYHYINFGNSIWWKLLELRFDEDFCVGIGELFEVVSFAGLTRENLIDTLKGCIDGNRLVMIKTDVYHFIRDSLHYHRTHMLHDWLISGYDDETGSFYCFGDYIGGFGEIEITAEDFKESLVPESCGEALELKIIKKIPPYVLSLGDVRENARRIKSSIARLSYCNFWKCHSVEYTEDRCFDISKFIGRQHANGVLFGKLFEQGLIGSALNGQMLGKCKALEEGWASLRGRMIKYLLSKRVPDYARVSREAWQLLKREYDMWSFFLESTGD